MNAFNRNLDWLLFSFWRELFTHIPKLIPNNTMCISFAIILSGYWKHYERAMHINDGLFKMGKLGNLQANETNSIMVHSPTVWLLRLCESLKFYLTMFMVENGNICGKLIESCVPVLNASEKYLPFQ